MQGQPPERAIRAAVIINYLDPNVGSQSRLSSDANTSINEMVQAIEERDITRIEIFSDEYLVQEPFDFSSCNGTMSRATAILQWMGGNQIDIDCYDFIFFFQHSSSIDNCNFTLTQNARKLRITSVNIDITNPDHGFVGSVLTQEFANSIGTSDIVNSGVFYPELIGDNTGIEPIDFFCRSSGWTDGQFWDAQNCNAQSDKPSVQMDGWLGSVMCPGSSNVNFHLSACAVDESSIEGIDGKIASNNLQVFDYPINPGCLICEPIVSLEIDNKMPDINQCGAEDGEFNVTFSIKNDCFTNEPRIGYKARVRIKEDSNNSNPTKIFKEENGWSYITLSGVLYFQKALDPIQVGEQIEFQLKAEVDPLTDLDTYTLFGLFANENISAAYYQSPNVLIFPQRSKLIVSEGNTVSLSNLIDAQEIPNDLAQDVEWQIEGTLIIDENYEINSTSDFKSRVKMGVDGKIIVQDHVLTIEDAAFVNCQNAMWKGIEVVGNGILVANKTRFHNAEYGVKAHENSHVVITNCEFYNNYHAIDLTAAPTGNTNYPFFGKFYGNRIYSDGYLLWPYEGQQTEVGLAIKNRPAGVIGIPSIGVIDPNFILDPAMTTFSGLNNGIVATNTELLVDNVQFRDIENTAIKLTKGSLLMEGDGDPLEMTFTNVGNGITSSGGRIKVSGQAFMNVDNGIGITNVARGENKISNNNFYHFKNRAISLSFLSSFEIFDNKLTAHPEAKSFAKGISVVGITNRFAAKSICNNTIRMEKGSRGIQLLAASHLSLTNNVITMGSDAEAGLHIEGGYNLVLAENSAINYDENNQTKGFFIKGNHSSTFSCNNYNKNETGINFFGICDQTDFRGSGISDATRGLTLGLFPDIGGTIIYPQIHRGNEWTGSFEDFGAYFAGPLEDSDNSRFLIDDSPPPNNFNTTTNILGWFITADDQSSTFNCPSQTNVSLCASLPEFIPEGPFSNGNDEILASGISLPGFSGTSEDWILRRHLIDRIHNGYSSLSESEANNFKSANLNKTFAVLNDVNLILLGYNEDVQYQNKSVNLTANFSTIDQKLSKLDSLQSLWLDQGITETELDQQTSPIFSTIEGIVMQNQTLESELENIESNYLNQASSQNSSIIPIETPASNEKLVNEIYFNGLDNSDIPQLESVALQCPLEGGDAVYTSRAFLVYLDYDFDSLDENLCQNGQSKLQVNENEMKSFISIWPNPTNDRINISAFVDQDLESLQLYNSLGNLVKTIYLNQGYNNFNLPLNNYASGIYYWKTDKIELLSNKLIIIH